MNSARTVVVTDVSSPSRFLRCLRQVVTSVADDVEIVAVSSRNPALPPAVARRVRKVSVRRGEKISTAVTAEATRPRFVVVVRSDCRVEGDWLDRLASSALGLGSAVGVVGGSDAFLIAFPEAAVTTDAPRVELPAPPGVGLGRDAMAAGAPRRNIAHGGSATITASLIVKDEAAAIGACVAAVRPFVDEVVVYDTGSQDATGVLAQEAGARVVEGFWDDDFGRARNRALEHCSGDWVLHVDADELVQGDPDELRSYVAVQTADLVRVPLVNTTWDGGQDGQQYLLPRLFRRERCRWDGALHEMLVALDGQPELTLAPDVAPLRIIHSGYAAATVELKDKVERNLTIARTAIESGDDSCAAWCNYGRTLAQAGRRDEALEALARVPERPGPDTLHVLAGRAALDLLVQRPQASHDIERWCEVLARHGESRGALTVRRSWFAMAAGELDQAEELLAAVPDDLDVWGLPVDPAEVASARASLLAKQGNAAEAWASVVHLVSDHPDRVPLRTLLIAALRAGHTYEDVVAVVSPTVLERSLRECLLLDPRDADRWLDAVWSATAMPGVAVAAALIGPHLAFERVLEWELRAFQLGLDGEASPLAVLASRDEVPALQRMLAAAVRWDVLLRPDAEADFRALMGSIVDDDVPAALALLDECAPGAAALARELLGDRVVSVTSGP